MAAEATERGAADSAGEMTGGAAEGVPTVIPTGSATSCGDVRPDEMAPVRSAYRDCLLRRELKALANPGQPAAEAVGEMTGGGGSDDGGGVGSDGAAAPLPPRSGATPGSGAVGSDTGEAPGERAGTSEAMCDDDEGGGGGDGKRQRGERGGKSGDVRRREAAKGRQRFLEEQRRM